MMRKVSVLASLVFFLLAAGGHWLGGVWGYLGLLSAALGGAALIFSGSLGIYYADQQALEQGSSWLWPVRDYRSLR